MRKHIFCDLQTEENDYEFVCYKYATQDRDRESKGVCLSCKHHCGKFIDTYSSKKYNGMSTEMNASKLMAMDFVTYQGRVVCITAVDVLVMSVRGVYTDNGEDTGWFNEDFATAIPLSEEMLMDNGFEYREFTGYESMHYNHLFTIYLNKDGEIFILIGGEQRWIRYANELQHALRVCNLNELDELANNFKVQ